MNMKSLNIKSLLLPAALIVLLASCEDDKMQPSLGGAITGSSISITEADMYPLGETVDFMIATEDTWTVSGMPNWVKLQKAGGSSISNNSRNVAGTTQLKLIASPNTPESDRSCTISFSSGNDTKTIRVTQPCPYLRVEFNGREMMPGETFAMPFTWYERDVYSSNHDIKVYSNIPWRIRPMVNNPSYNSKAGQTKLDVKGLQEDTSEDIIKYALDLSGQRIENWVNAYSYNAQGGKDLMFTNGQTYYSGNNDESAGFIPYSANTGEAEETLVYMIEPDEVSTLESVGITFSQPNLLFTVSGDVITRFDAAKTDEKPFVINCEHSWSLTEKFLIVDNTDASNRVEDGDNAASWLHMKDLQGSEIHMNSTVSEREKIVNVWADPNDTRYARVGNMYVSINVEGIDFSKKLQFQQKPFVLGMTSDYANVELNYNDKGSYPVTVESSGDWRISQQPAWLTLTGTSGVGGTTVSGQNDITAQETFNFSINRQNLQTSAESEKLRVQSVQCPNLYNEIDIIQKPFTWSAVINNADDENKNLIDFGAKNSKNSPIGLNLMCSSPWVVEVDYGNESPWLSISSMSGGICENTASTITFLPTGDNEKFKERRSAKITVRSVESGGNSQLKREFTVEQRGANFGITQSELTNYNMTFGEFNAPTQRVDIMSSHEWKVESVSESWINVTESPDTDGDGYIDVSVNNNYTKSERPGTITLKCAQLNITCIINVKQSPYVFEFSQQTYDLRAYAASPSYSGTLSSSAGWTVADNVSWITVSPSSGTSGAMNRNITFTVENNPTYSTREGTITFVSNYQSQGVASIPVKFVQDAFVFNTNASSSYSFEELDTRSYSFTVNCPGPWSFTKPSWATLSPASGTGSQTVTLSVARNTSTSARNGNIVLSNSVNQDTKTIPVSQQAYDWNGGTINSTAVIEALSSETRTISGIVSSGRWTASSNQSWAALSTSGGNSANGASVVASISKNYNIGSDRTATITVRSEDNTSLSKQFTITQKAFVFDPGATTAPTQYEAVNAGNKTITIADTPSTREGWVIKANDSWIKPAVTSGTGGATVQITVDNNSGAARTGTIEVASSHNANAKATVTITQKGFDFSVTAPADLNFAAADVTTKKSVTLKCTGKWKVTGDLTWLNVTPASGNGGAGDVTIQVNATTANTATAARSAKIRIESEDFPNVHFKEITFTQAAAPAPQQ